MVWLSPPDQLTCTGIVVWPRRRRGTGAVAVGGVASTVKLREAGVWSVFPTASVARTSRVWSPSASEL